MKKHILKMSIFSIIFIVLFGYFSSMLRFQYGDGITPMEDLYLHPKNTIDVLLVGGSRIAVGVDPSVLWKNYGIASYTLWGTGQPLWNSYFNLKEALKTQNPKLVILDVFDLTQNFQYDDCNGQIKNTLGMRFSLNKIMDVIDSVPEGSRMDFILGFPVYHINYKGFETFGGKPDLTDKYVYISNNAESVELPKKQEKYLKEIIELLKGKNIPLLIIAFPPYYTNEEQIIYSKVGEIASRDNIPFINFNLLYNEIGFDNSTDLADRLHCNCSGKKKITKYLEKYLRVNYNLPDRRNNPNPIYKNKANYSL